MVCRRLRKCCGAVIGPASVRRKGTCTHAEEQKCALRTKLEHQTLGSVTECDQCGAPGGAGFG